MYSIKFLTKYFSVLFIAFTATSQQADASFTGITEGENICSNSLPISLTANNHAGVYSGVGVTNIGSGLGTGEFNPQIAGVGNRSVNYKIGKNFVSVASGRTSAFAIADDGSLWSWGNPNYRRLGYYLPNSQPNQTTPRRVQLSNNWKEISAIYDHCLALQNDNSLWSWGYNANGELGNGGGSDQISQIGTATDWTGIGAGQNHSLAVKSDGTLWSWGSNNYGQLGLGNLLSVNVPTQVGNDTDWVSVGAGGQFSCAIKSNGTMWTCGYNDAGQLGDGTTVDRNVFEQVGTDSDWGTVSAGLKTAFCIKINGLLYGWGENTFGTLGNGTTSDSHSPILIGIGNWKKISIDFASVMGIRSDGTLWSWGFDWYGECGQNNNPISQSQIGTDTDWLDCAMGYTHSIALKENGNIWAAGQASLGLLGNGTSPVDNQNILIETITHDEKTISVTVIEGPNATDVHVVCDSLIWKDGITYTASNTSASFRVQNAASNGCDSVYYLSLTVHSAITHNQSLTECGSAIINGTSYSSSQIVTDTLSGQSSNGCDSIVITDLVIKDATNSTATITECKQYTWINGVTYTTSNTTAEYVIPNSVGCDSTIFLDLTINNVYDISVTQNEPTLTANVSGAQYQWYDCGGFDIFQIPNATNQSFTPVYNGMYLVQITQNGCVDTSSCYSIVSAGISDLSFNQFNLFPNPSKDGKFNFSSDYEIISMTFHDLTGRAVDFDVDLLNKTINGTNLPRGTYFVFVVTTNGTTVKEFVL